MPVLPVFTGFLVAAIFVILPTIVMTLRFSQEEKRIPVSIIIENDCFTIDRQTFRRAEVQNFTLTAPVRANTGTSHRMHLSFTSGRKRYVYMLGSGTVQKVTYPDYNLLNKAFDAQRIYVERGASSYQQARRMIEASVYLSKYTKATILYPRKPELKETVRLISGGDASLIKKVEEIINDPYKFAKNHSYELMYYGIAEASSLAVDVVMRSDLAILLEVNQYAVMMIEDEYVNGVLGKLSSIIEAHALPIDLSVFTYSNEVYALNELRNISNQLQMQGYQLGAFNVLAYNSLFFIKTADIHALKKVVVDLGMELYFDFLFNSEDDYYEG